MTALVVNALLCVAVLACAFVLLAKFATIGVRRPFRMLLTSVIFVAGISLAGICHAVERQRELSNFEAGWYPFAGFVCAIALAGALLGSWKLHRMFPPRRCST